MADAEREPVRLDSDYGAGLDALVSSLASLGYTRATLVENRGEFAVRGGLVDVFPATAEHPVRVEFWGDDVDTLRQFSAGDQRSLGPIDGAVVDPVRELVLDEETAQTARALARARPGMASQLEQLADGVAFEGMESLVTAIHPAPAYLPDFFPEHAGTTIVEPRRTADRAGELREQAAPLTVAGWGAGDGDGERPDDDAVASADGDVGFGEWEAVQARARGPLWTVSPFAGSADEASEPAVADSPAGEPAVGEAISGRPWESFRGDIATAAAQAHHLSAGGTAVVLTTSGHGSALRLQEVLGEQGLATPVVEQAPAPGDGGRMMVCESPLREGFAAEELGVAVLGEWDLFGPRRSRGARRLPSKRGASESIVDLEPGDFVVHSVHGVGHYTGMVTRQLAGPTTQGGSGTASWVTRDYVVVEYAGGDRLFVPSDAVDALAPYVGGEQPRVMRMGGADWERARSKVRESVREMAGELVRLYAARMEAAGTAFGPDTAWQAELETAFPYTETPDQLAAIDDVKADLEASAPMDRLICGDVGFGKTEIAVRAAAKAVFDGKQVAVLVPTTLLAQQHHETFTERFAGFPVNIAMLSRFTSGAEQRRILDGAAAGSVDLVIGTHRLLGEDVSFATLGLLVVDEEQRFGVGHKEKLKQLRTNVDVLTMTATPIPRTMEMALTGVRGMSTIETPPEDRQPVVTHVGNWDESLAALALRRELLRDGQVFWVHNQVDTIEAAAERVRELVPTARIAVAHGRMDEDRLEQVMVAFWQREFDVLVCTTIIESGLDIPNANTLIVERAELLGLAQIYQLRGRVGRSAERGYAYLFFPPDERMTEEAYQRLETVATHTGLSSGLSIALRDLEIRGAGSVLSPEQSGHVATVGFEEYSRLMQEAIEEFRGGEPEEPEPEITVDLPVDAHLPADYIPDEGLRLEAYRKIAAVRDSSGVKAVRAELADRYGALPGAAERLLNVAALRGAARRWGVTDITTTPRRTVRVSPVTLSESQEVRLSREYPSAIANPSQEALEVPLPSEIDGDDLVGWVAGTLKRLLSAPQG
jgi:transcription-repair coupling factor (superfamily II helicase)